MDNFVEGVWATFRLTPDEEALVPAVRGVHFVLVEGAIRELRRLAATRLRTVSRSAPTSCPSATTRSSGSRGR